jgi:hypothetical protein
MPLDTAESIEAAFAALGLGQKILAAAKALPPVTEARPRKAADFAPILEIVGKDLLPLVDKVAADVAD